MSDYRKDRESGPTIRAFTFVEVLIAVETIAFLKAILCGDLRQMSSIAAGAQGAGRMRAFSAASDSNLI